MSGVPRAGISKWGSIAQAARTPSAVESRGTITTFIVPGLPPIRGANNADGSFDSEQLTAYEIGFRIQPTETTSLDVALFNNHYSDVATYETEEIYIFNNPFTPLAPPQIIPIMTNFDNKMEVTSRGIEVLFDWRIVAGWHLQSAYTYINTTTNKDNDSNDQYADLSVEGGTPEHHITLRSMYDLSDNVAFDVWAYYVDDLESTSLSAVRSSTIDSYTSINMRLSWNLLDKLELSLVGQNLFDNRHQEFVGEYYILRTEVERSIYGQVKYEF